MSSSETTASAGGSSTDLSRLEIGPLTISGRRVLLRRPRYDDAARWRRIRLADQRYIEPFWVSDDADWASRHTRRRWIRFCLEGRRSARAGTDASWVIEVDGVFSGQVELGSIDWQSRSAELGIWIDSTTARSGAAGLAAMMLTDVALGHLGLVRLALSVSVENRPALATCARLGIRREALMIESLDVGGRRQDHFLLALTRAPSAAPSRHARDWIRRWSGPDADVGEVPFQVVTRSGTRWCDRPMVAWEVAQDIVQRLAGKRRGGTSEEDVEHGTLLRDSEDPCVLLRGEARVTGGVRRFRVEHRGTPRIRCGVEVKPAPSSIAVLWLQDHERADPVLVGATVRTLTRHAFQDLSLHRVVMALPPDDHILRGAVTAAGLHREGTVHCYTDPTGRFGDFDLWGLARSGRTALDRTDARR